MGFVPRLLDPHLEPTIELPRRGVAEFVRLVRSDRTVKVLGAKIPLPHSFVHRYVRAILYVRTERLVVQCEGERVELPFPLSP